MGLKIALPYVFNFAASWRGGGFKRLYEYAAWFQDRGGAFFIVNRRSLARLRSEFPGNRYLGVDPPLVERLFYDCRYLREVGAITGRPELYYAYGIPIYRPFGRVNWFHLSNVLPVHPLRDIPLPFKDRVRLAYLGWRIRRNLHQAEVVSAESEWSLGLLADVPADRLVVSVNGSDDEIEARSAPRPHPAPRDIAVVVGTYTYKALDDSYRLFLRLRREHSSLRLLIAGDPRFIPDDVREADGVEILGLVDRTRVITLLKSAKFYISTTTIENSYNAASEGAALAAYSYVSDIGPHRELFAGVSVEKTVIPDLDRPLYHLSRETFRSVRLKTWNEVIVDMLQRVEPPSDA